ncbi:hypothetical protein PAXRUDRAFT_822245 [Paxillus rubicundulus Ve08.2h10]|uniref:Uncharacterized protein n=1 Tax=Paxillus rubicundulus Ve08.2h10 TaxID=930991 RepID=A0A0D0EA16_9AGAM|nr:hypothetical protein PAXRUDRAFT_822245 [Paxillus rubicundulus Ve08.2h10]
MMYRLSVKVSHDVIHTAPIWASVLASSQLVGKCPSSHGTRTNLLPMPRQHRRTINTIQATYQYQPYHSGPPNRQASIPYHHSSITLTVANEPGAGQKAPAVGASAGAAWPSDPEPNTWKAATTLVDCASNNSPASSRVFGIGPCGQSAESPKTRTQHDGTVC